jgi:hypothetical protein
MFGGVTRNMVRASNYYFYWPGLILALNIGSVVRYGPNRLVFNTEPGLKGNSLLLLSPPSSATFKWRW